MPTQEWYEKHLHRNVPQERIAKGLGVEQKDMERFMEQLQHAVGAANLPDARGQDENGKTQTWDAALQEGLDRYAIAYPDGPLLDQNAVPTPRFWTAAVKRCIESAKSNAQRKWKRRTGASLQAPAPSPALETQGQRRSVTYISI